MHGYHWVTYDIACTHISSQFRFELRTVRFYLNGFNLTFRMCLFLCPIVCMSLFFFLFRSIRLGYYLLNLSFWRRFLKTVYILTGSFFLAEFNAFTFECILQRGYLSSQFLNRGSQFLISRGSERTDVRASFCLPWRKSFWHCKSSISSSIKVTKKEWYSQLFKNLIIWLSTLYMLFYSRFKAILNRYFTGVSPLISK